MQNKSLEKFTVKEQPILRWLALEKTQRDSAIAYMFEPRSDPVSVKESVVHKNF